MDYPVEYKLATAGGRLARFAFFPVAILTAYLSTRSYVLDGVTFIMFDALTITGICLSLGLALVTFFWWEECGHGLVDCLLLVAGSAPLFVLLWRLDPLGLTPAVF